VRLAGDGLASGTRLWVPFLLLMTRQCRMKESGDGEDPIVAGR
jgi:hypothetical protein